MYGKNVYGLSLYGQNDPESIINPDDYYVDLIRYAPPYFKGIRELVEIWRTQGYEIGLLEYYVSDLVRQAYITTATWGLTLWEDVYAVTTNLALSYEQRREILYAKIRGQGTTTIQMIKLTAESFSGGEVDVIEDNPNHFFIVRFIGIKGIPRNMAAFISMLEDIKPAHLSYSFEYTYTIWNDLVGKVWNDLSGMTWGEVRIMKED